MTKKIPEWKKKQRSVSRELGWGSAKEGGDKKRNVHSVNEYDGRLICRCGERRSMHIMEARPDYWYCDICGFEGDIDSWDYQVKTSQKKK